MPPLEPGALAGLIARVSDLAGGSVEIDAAITALFYRREERFIGEQAEDGPSGTWRRVATPVWVDPRTDRWVSTKAFDFTADLRDAMRLIARLPGGWQISTTSPDLTRPGHAGRAWAKVQPFQVNDEGWRIGARDATGATVPIALTCAALMALAGLADLAEAPPQEIATA